MSELSFEQMLEDSVKTIRNGEIVQGKVIDVKEDEIILNIGYKADGIITKSEYSNDPSVVLTDAVHVGDSMEAKVLKVNDGEGQVILTYKRLAAEKGNKRLEEAFENQEVLKAPVTQVLDGGLCVNVEETRVFIPASLVSDTYEKDLSKYADQEIEFVITEFNPRRRRIIGNRKQLLVAEKAKKQQELMERIHVGDTVEGVVKNVTDFGAFIDLGGADGVTASSADAENADAFFIHQRMVAQKVGGGAEILHPRFGAFDITRFAAAFAVMRSVESERHITAFRQFLRIKSGSLLLYASERMADDDRGMLPGAVDVFRDIQVAGHFNPETVPETDLLHDDFFTGQKGVVRGRGAAGSAQRECRSRQNRQCVLFHDRFSFRLNAGPFFQRFGITVADDFDFFERRVDPG